MKSELTLSLVSGYDRSKTPTTKTYRRMTIEEAKGLSYGVKVPFLANDGTCREVKVNGEVKTWKRDLTRVRVPVKYGMYEFGYFESLPSGYVGTIGGANYLLVEVKEGD